MEPNVVSDNYLYNRFKKKIVLTLGHIFSKRQLFKQQTLAFSDRAMGPLLIIKFKSLVSGVVFLKNETENPKKRKILQILKIFGHDDIM